MDFITVLGLIRTATNAVGEAKEAYEQVKGSLGKENEAELKAAMDKMRAENDALYESVQAKLDAASRT